MDIRLGYLFDMPNIQMFLEHVYHNIPTFGHIRVISEVLFESIHQTLKQFMRRNPHTLNTSPGIIILSSPIGIGLSFNS